MKLYLLLTLLIFSVSACSSLKRAKVLLPSSCLNMQNIAENIYVEKGMSLEEKKKLKEEVFQARIMLQKFYGEVTTHPIVYACATEECAKKFGLEGKIRAVRLLGYLLLKPKELIRTTIVHEWSHEELYMRIGGFYHWYKEIPVWFDEGLATLAMQKHSRYDEEAWKRIIIEKLPYPTVEELRSLVQWTDALNRYLTNDEIVVSYATARHIVTFWYERVGKKGLVKFLDNIKKGKKFKKIY